MSGVPSGKVAPALPSNSSLAGKSLMFSMGAFLYNVHFKLVDDIEIL